MNPFVDSWELELGENETVSTTKFPGFSFTPPPKHPRIVTVPSYDFLLRHSNEIAFERYPNLVSVAENSIVDFRCRSDDVFPPVSGEDISWFHNNQSVNFAVPDLFQKPDKLVSELRFKSFAKEYEGIWHCEGLTTRGEKMTSTRVPFAATTEQEAERILCEPTIAHICKNGGTCYKSSADSSRFEFDCLCPPTFAGKVCEEEISTTIATTNEVTTTESLACQTARAVYNRNVIITVTLCSAFVMVLLLCFLLYVKQRNNIKRFGERLMMQEEAELRKSMSAVTPEAPKIDVEKIQLLPDMPHAPPSAGPESSKPSTSYAKPMDHPGHRASLPSQPSVHQQQQQNQNQHQHQQQNQHQHQHQHQHQLQHQHQHQEDRISFRNSQDAELKNPIMRPKAYSMAPIMKPVSTRSFPFEGEVYFYPCCPRCVAEQDQQRTGSSKSIEDSGSSSIWQPTRLLKKLLKDGRVRRATDPYAFMPATYFKAVPISSVNTPVMSPKHENSVSRGIQVYSNNSSNVNQSQESLNLSYDEDGNPYPATVSETGLKSESDVFYNNNETVQGRMMTIGTWEWTLMGKPERL